MLQTRCRYRKLLQEVRTLQARHCYLSQKDEHYERLEKIIGEGVDSDKLARLLGSKPGVGQVGSKKRKGKAGGEA